LRIAIPLLNVTTSGGTRVIFQYAAGLAARSHDVTVVLAGKPAQGYFDLPRNVTVRKTVVSHRSARLFGYASGLSQIARALPDCDAILVPSWQSALTAFLSKRGHIPVFYLIQGDDAIINSARPALVRWRNAILYRQMYRGSFERITVSSWLQRVMLEKYGQSSVCIPNGVDAEAFAAAAPARWRPPSRSFDILCLARAARWKGFDDVVEAARLIRTREPRTRLVVGTHERLSLPSDMPVVLRRPRDDPDLGSLYRTCSVFVFASWWEGFGLPPLEAMACGVPVVTTDCGGVNEYARDGENCLMVPPRDPRALAEAIERLRQDVGLTRSLANGGLETARQFTVERAVSSLDELILDRLA